MTEFERGRRSGIVSGLRMAMTAVAVLDQTDERPLRLFEHRRVRSATYRIAVREINEWLAIALRDRPLLWNRRNVG